MQVVRPTPDEADWPDGRRIVLQCAHLVGADAESPTGAVHMYEHAGMRVLWRSDAWEKGLRADA